MTYPLHVYQCRNCKMVATSPVKATFVEPIRCVCHSFMAFAYTTQVDERPVAIVYNPHVNDPAWAKVTPRAVPAPAAPDVPVTPIPPRRRGIETPIYTGPRVLMRESVVTPEAPHDPACPCQTCMEDFDAAVLAAYENRAK